MLNFSRKGFLALQQHLQGRDEPDAADGLKAGVVIDLMPGLVGLAHGLFPLRAALAIDYPLHPLLPHDDYPSAKLAGCCR
jgi:hypothetical protein